MRIEEALAGVTRLGLDTAPIIYFTEANPRYTTRVDGVFRHLSMHSIVGITSIVMLGEVLVHPIASGNTRLVDQYRNLLLGNSGVVSVPVDPIVAERAAELRARYRLRMPDALQVATAIEQRCDAFLTNDRGLGRVAEIRVLVLDDLEA